MRFSRTTLKRRSRRPSIACWIRRAFGERLALEWLDVARYGDTDGLFEDHPRSIYPWRDWLIRAFNDNLPYDEFISWQLAGDLYGNASTDQKLATGFLRNNPTSNEGGIIDEDYRIKYLVDRVNTTSTAFLGLTMECAQCHDHKFDPMTQKEYFQFGGFFNSLVGKGNTKGATAPTIKLFKPQEEARLAKLSAEIALLEETLAASPSKLLADFKTWNEKIDKPVEWQESIVHSNSSGDHAPSENSEPNPSDVSGQFVRIALPKGSSGYLTISEVEILSGGRNVARGGKATQSSVGYNSPAAKAVDGNKSGSFGSCSCTNSEKDAWWEIDLESESAIDHIIIWNRNDCCPERLDRVSVAVLNSERKPVETKQLGGAAFQNTVTLNPNAPAVASDPTSYVVAITPASKEVAALRFEAKPGTVVGSVKLEVVSELGAKELKLSGNAKFIFEKDPKILGLEKSVVLTKAEQLRLTVTGGPVTVATTADPTAVHRATIPKENDKRLEHFRKDWPGFRDTRERLAAAKKEKGDIEGKAPVSMIAADEAAPRTTHVLMRGEYDQPGVEVQPAAPASILPFDDALPKNRLGLAQWMVDPANPLTARVAVNRYWQMLFGSGIVKTSEDFGTQGARPSHQALLDYLAVEFVESGWNLKALLRQILTSATYRQSSVMNRRSGARDTENRLLSHFPRQRLPAEFIRDHVLSVSGLLVDKRGGPGVHPYQPAELFGRNAIGASNAAFKLGSGDDLYRRSLYTYWKRQIPAANMRILGADGRTACKTRRERTNTPLQALVLLNDPQFVEGARVFAERIMTEGGETLEERLQFGFRLATSRHATAVELNILTAEFRDRLRVFAADNEAAGKYLNGGGVRKPAEDLPTVELAAYAAVAALLLNLDESISKS